MSPGYKTKTALPAPKPDGEPRAGPGRGIFPISVPFPVATKDFRPGERGEAVRRRSSAGSPALE
jgi:hypothetical protein